MVRMPENAPVVVLLFLATLAILATATALLLGSLAGGRLRRARRILEGMAVIVLIYAGTLLTFSLTSRERVLGPGQEKYLCEIDCHLSYSVASVFTARTLGSGSRARSAAGVFYAITVRTMLDDRTISPNRGDSPLWPNPRRLVVQDPAGRRYSPSQEGLRALASEGKGGIPMDHPLRPGESYSTTLVFDLPRDLRDAKLLITEDMFLTRFLIDHENSFLHPKVWFEVRPPPGDAGPDDELLCYTASPWKSWPPPSTRSPSGSERTTLITAASRRS
jgi:hypothetical protein